MKTRYSTFFKQVKVYSWREIAEVIGSLFEVTNKRIVKIFSHYDFVSFL